MYPRIAPKIARTAEHSRTGKAIPKGVISQFEAAEAKKDREIEKVILSKETIGLGRWNDRFCLFCYGCSRNRNPRIAANETHIAGDWVEGKNSSSVTPSRVSINRPRPPEVRVLVRSRACK